MKVHTFPPYILFIILLLLLAPLNCRAISITEDNIARMIHTSDAFASIAEQTKPSVVYVFVKKSLDKSSSSRQKDVFYNDPLVKEFFGSQTNGSQNQQLPESLTSYASGSVR